jgi:pimeloyl-ACP methyl ester carboxylesterase
MLRSIETASGRISCAEEGTGPVSLFVHGVLLNKHLWRYQLAGLSDIRRCIAVDLLAHAFCQSSRQRLANRRWPGYSAAPFGEAGEDALC